MSRPFVLPTELLVHIFELATDNPVRDIDALVELPSFESAAPLDVDELCDAALRTKHAIATTCRAFWDISTEFFYEDIRVRYGSKSLVDILENSQTERSLPLGTLVKRAVLYPPDPTDQHVSTRMTQDTQRILMCCPNLRAIFRPQICVARKDDEWLDNEALGHDFPLENVQRVDWSSSPCDDPPVIAQIPHSVWSCKGLRTLSVGVDDWNQFSGIQETETTEIFSHINTLRVRSLDAFGIPGQRLFTLMLPKLKRIVLDQPDSMYALFSIYQYGSQIETMEFGAHPGFLQHDYIAVLLVYCPNATDLYIPIFSMHPTKKNQEGYIPATLPITHLCLSAMLRDGTGVLEESKWDHLLAHFDTFCGPLSRFVDLKRITLFGPEWLDIVKDYRMQPLLSIIRSKGIMLESNDPVVHDHLSMDSEITSDASMVIARKGVLARLASMYSYT